MPHNLVFILAVFRKHVLGSSFGFSTLYSNKPVEVFCCRVDFKPIHHVNSYFEWNVILVIILLAQKISHHLSPGISQRQDCS